ncbi:MAG: hypothetical protein H6704_18795 [Myxococcales bacterium]|nr:hypothetical protein [Myxococcales bacterium]
MNNFRALALCAAALAVTACDDDHGDDHDHGGETLADEACEHTTEGPYRDVTATVDAADGPVASFEHTGVRIALVDVMGGKGGFVTFESAEAADFTFFLSANVPLTLQDATGAPVAIEDTADVDACAEVAVQYTAELEVGTYRLSFGPTEATTVTLVAEAAGEAHDHE